MEPDTGTDRWDEPPARIRVGPDDVHVWRAGLDLPAAPLAAYERLLADDERARAARFHFATHRRRFVAARGILRVILGRYLGLAPADICFAYGAHGKPALARPAGEPLRFNLSHSHELALIAVAHHREVGVDVERERDRVPARAIAERFFSPAEQATLRALPAAAAWPTFFRLWACKEAYVKATGEGVSRPLDAIVVELGDPEPRLRLAGEPADASRWVLRELRPARGYAAALVVERPGWRLSCWQWRET